MQHFLEVRIWWATEETNPSSPHQSYSLQDVVVSCRAVSGRIGGNLYTS